MTRKLPVWHETRVSRLVKLALTTTDSFEEMAVELGVGTNGLRHKYREIGLPRRGPLRGASARWRGKLPIPTKGHPLVRLLYEEMNRQKILISEVAERAGCSRETIGEWGWRKEPRLSVLIACFNVLGMELIAVDKSLADQKRKTLL